jgi:hypothetical protein
MINYAQLLYGQTKGEGINLLRPRLTYEFTVTFISSVQSEGKPITFIAPALNADYPQMTVDTITLNQYNRPRVVQTKLRWNPVNFTIYNTQDASTEQFFSQVIYPYYYNYLINTGEEIINSPDPSVSQSIFGYKNLNSTKYMFKTIVISRGNTTSANNLTEDTKDKVDAIILEYPVITNISGTQFSYSESTPQTVTMTVQPENVVIGNVDIKEKESLDV